MEVFKKILIKLLFPHLASILVLVPVAAALLIYSFGFKESGSPIAYLSYFLSAYALLVVCMRAPSIFKKLKTAKDKNKYITRYMSDAQLRVKISLYSSLAVNTAYGVFQLGLGVYHSSVWFYSLAAYYIMLAIMRFFLLRDVKAASSEKNMLSELMRYRFCGVILLIMNLALAVIVFYISWWKRGFVHHPITTIAMAAYTFASLTMAIINVVKYRKYKSPVYSASKAISLAAATVSMLTLETAMLTAFGEENSETFRSVMTSSTGAAVCLFVLVMAIYMIVRSSREIKIHRIMNMMKSNMKGNPR